MWRCRDTVKPESTGFDADGSALRIFLTHLYISTEKNESERIISSIQAKQRLTFIWLTSVSRLTLVQLSMCFSSQRPDRKQNGHRTSTKAKMAAVQSWLSDWTIFSVQRSTSTHRFWSNWNKNILVFTVLLQSIGHITELYLNRPGEAAVEQTRGVTEGREPPVNFRGFVDLLTVIKSDGCLWWVSRNTENKTVRRAAEPKFLRWKETLR